VSVVGAVVLVVVLVVATAIGLVLRRRTGRIRQGTTGTTPGWQLADVEPGPDDRVLLLQLSSPICTPCERTREQLTALAAGRPDVRHVEVDIAERPEIARALHVMRTPTTVAFDRDGTELLRVGGVPRHADLVAALPVEETR
jgi:thiol-disulfide isomerase/thioredoxin